MEGSAFFIDKSRNRKEGNLIKKRTKKRLGVLCMVIGLGFAFYSQIEDRLLAYSVTQLAEQPLTAKKVEENKEKGVSFNFEEVEPLDLGTILSAQATLDSVPVIGKISIPSVHLNLPIGLGTSSSTLALTAGTMKKEQVMGEGNYSLAGHDSRSKDVLFSPLHRVEIGSTVYLTDAIFVYEYEVTDKETILPTKVSVIKDKDEETLLTLITCDDGGSTRLLVTGQFIKKLP